MPDLRLLRSFVAVAEHEHVGLAARKLGISQSPLSRQIQQLEEMLDLKLFQREKQRIHLTDGGRWLLGEALVLLQRVDRLKTDAGRFSRGETGRVTVGFISRAMSTGILPDAIRRFSGIRPEVEIELRHARPEVQIEALRSGEIDLAVVASARATSTEFKSTKLHEEPMVVAIPSGHTLSKRKPLTVRDLEGAPWIAISSAHQNESARLMAACIRAGFTPNLRYEAPDPATLISLVTAGLGLALVPASVGSEPHKGIVLRSLSALTFKSQIYLMTMSSGVSVAGQVFARTLIQCAEERN